MFFFFYLFVVHIITTTFLQPWCESKSVSSAEPIRIVYDFDLVHSNSMVTPEIFEMIDGVVKSSTLYLQKLIRLEPRKSPISVPATKNICYDLPMSEKVMYPNGVSDADLFIIVDAYYNISTSVAANAVTCYVDGRPVVGRIRLNLNTYELKSMEQKNELFKGIFTHELFHVLGFSYVLSFGWINPTTGLNYDTRVIYEKVGNRQYQPMLITPNVKTLFRNHFACTPSSDISMPLDNSSRSHWAGVSIQNEMMDPYVMNHQSQFTQFSAALLKDTGFYSEINENFVEFSGWGLNQGCRFVQENCLSGKYQYQEFIYPADSEGGDEELEAEADDESTSYSCDVNGQGKGSLTKVYDPDGVCASIQINERSYCTLLQHEDVEAFAYSGEVFHANSKCHSSNLRINTIWNPFHYVYGNSRCFATTCNEDGTLTLKSQFSEVRCEYPGQRIEMNSTSNKEIGFVVCPLRFKLFCYAKNFCPGNCHLNGFCNKGTCVCVKGFGGEDCSQKLTEGVVITATGQQLFGECTPGTFLSLNHVCVTKCPQGYFGENSVCNECSSRCSECAGAGTGKCVKCALEYLLVDGECFESDNCIEQGLLLCRLCQQKKCFECKIGSYLSEIGTCVKCPQNCRQCSGSVGKCEICNPRFTLSEGSCIDKSKIQLGCDELDQNDKRICRKCKKGFALNSQAECVKCPKHFFFESRSQSCQSCDVNCKSCIYRSNRCMSCPYAFILNSAEHRCIPIQLGVSSINLKTSLEEGEKKNCHFSCNNCFSGEFSQCYECKGNRVLRQTSDPSQSICECPVGTTEMNLELCVYKQTDMSLRVLAGTSVWTYLGLHGFDMVTGNSNGVATGGVLATIYVYQFFAHLRYIELHLPLGIDSLLHDGFQFLNAFNFQVFFDAQSLSGERSEVNLKYLLEKRRSGASIENSLILVILVGAFNAILVCLMRNKRQVVNKNQRTLKVVAIAGNVFAIQELSLHICMGVSFNEINIVDLIASGLVLGLLLAIIFKFAVAIESAGDSIQNKVVDCKSLFDDEETGRVSAATEGMQQRKSERNTFKLSNMLGEEQMSENHKEGESTMLPPSNNPSPPLMSVSPPLNAAAASSTKIIIEMNQPFSLLELKREDSSGGGQQVDTKNSETPRRVSRSRNENADLRKKVLKKSLVRADSGQIGSADSPVRGSDIDDAQFEFLPKKEISVVVGGNGNLATVVTSSFIPTSSLRINENQIKGTDSLCLAASINNRVETSMQLPNAALDESSAPQALLQNQTQIVECSQKKGMYTALVIAGCCCVDKILFAVIISILGKGGLSQLQWILMSQLMKVVMMCNLMKRCRIEWFESVQVFVRQQAQLIVGLLVLVAIAVMDRIDNSSSASAFSQMILGYAFVAILLLPLLVRIIISLVRIIRTIILVKKQARIKIEQSKHPEIFQVDSV